MKLNFDQIPDATGGTLPEGKYLGQVVDVEEKRSAGGDEYWTLKIQIGGKTPYAGWHVYDNLFFASEKALQRVKLVLGRLGLRTTGEIELTPKMVLGRQATIDVVHEDYEDKTGKMRKIARVPYAGYERVTDLGNPARDERPAKEKESLNPLPF